MIKIDHSCTRAVVLNLFLCSSPLANQPIRLFPLERYIRKTWFPVRIIFVLRKKDNIGTIWVSHIWYKQNNFLIPTTLLVGFLALLLGSQMVNVRDGGRQGTILKGIRLKAPAKSSPLELQKFPPGGTFPPVKNHCTRVTGHTNSDWGDCFIPLTEAIHTSGWFSSLT